MENGKCSLLLLPCLLAAGHLLMTPASLRPFNVSTFGGIHADAVTFINKGWDGDGNPVFECGRFVDVGDSCPLHRGVCAGYGEFKRRRQVNADGRAFIKLSLQPQPGIQPLSCIAQTPLH